MIFACHGGPANNADHLATTLRPLEDSFSIVYHDYRGSGLSEEARPSTYTFEQMAADLDELRLHLGQDRMVLLAHSMGGFVALNFALRHPDACKRMALISTTPTFRIAGAAMWILGPVRGLKLLVRASWYLSCWSWRRESPKRRRARYSIIATTQEGVRAVRAQVKAANHDLPIQNDNVAYLEKLISRTDLTDALGRLTCPVLVLYGERDAFMVAGGRLLVRHLPHSQLVILPKVGHEPFLEEPESCFDSVREFLGEDETGFGYPNEV
jgi:proline iminopeptidase